MNESCAKLMAKAKTEKVKKFLLRKQEAMKMLRRMIEMHTNFGNEDFVQKFKKLLWQEKQSFYYDRNIPDYACKGGGRHLVRMNMIKYSIKRVN